MRWLAILAAGALTGCTLAAPPARIIHQQGRTVVQLETDPSAGSMAVQGWNTHPAVIKPAEMAMVLRGIRIRSEHGAVGALLGLPVPSEPVFTDDEVALLAPVLASGLGQASPAERVAFTLWSPQPLRRNAPLSGHIAIREPALRFGLNDHPTVGWQDPEDPASPKLFALEFMKQSFLLPSGDEERRGTRKTRPLIHINYRQYLNAPADRAAPAAQAKEPTPPAMAGPVPPREPAPSDSASVKDLQRQVKELSDESARLRQELAETKQLLADKMLELNRLKSQAGGSGEGKK